MDKTTKQFIVAQRKELEVAIDKRFKEVDKQFGENDKRIKKVAKTLTKRIDDQAEESRRYLGGLKEDWNSTFQTIIEMLRGVSKRNEKIDIMFDHMGQQEMDITITKDAVRNHEVRIKKLEKVM